MQILCIPVVIFYLVLLAFKTKTMLGKLRTVIYHVDNLMNARQWYIDLTGIQPYFDEPFYVGFDINGCELGLDPDINGVTRNQTVAYWSVSDIHSAVDKCVMAGGTITSPITNVGSTIEVAIIEDPFGNNLGLIAGA